MYKDRYELTVDKIFASSVRNNPDQVISYQGKKDVTFTEFMDQVYRVARGLVKMGLKKGDRVAVLDWDSLHYMEAYYAVPMAGGVLHTVNIRYPQELIYYTMQHAEDRFVIIRDEFVPLIEKSISLFDFVEKWIISSDSDEPAGRLPGSIDYSDLEKMGQGVDLPNVSEDDVATTFYTSGTTGLPKGVYFTHRQILLHAMSVALGLSKEPFSLKTTDVIMPLVPMFHVHSWGSPYITIMSGQKYVLPGRYDFDLIPEIMEKEGVTFSEMVPSILYMLVTGKAKDKMKGLNLKVSIGGSALTEGLAKLAESMNITVAGGYGMSETAPVLTLSTYNKRLLEEPDGKRAEYHRKTGIPIPFVDLKVVDSEGKEVSHDSRAIGEIVVRAPWLAKEYVKDDVNTQKLWKGDWLHTGDLAVVDDLGYVSIVDREKDAIKSGGEFIPSLILEEVISTFPGIGEVAVIGKPDDKWGERPVAFVTSTDGVDEEKLKQHLMEYANSGRIAKFWIPDEFIKIAEFEKTSTGKIDKKPLVRRYKDE